MTYTTLKQLLERYEVDVADMSVDERLEYILSVIVNEAQPWIDACHGDLKLRMLRGVSGDGGDVDIRKVRSTRDPMSLSAVTTAVANNAIKRSRLAANRTNSIMCTGNEDFAEAFGSVMVIIPLGPFRYTWIPEVVDLNDWLEGTIPYDGDIHDYEQTEADMINSVKWAGDDDTMVQAIASGHEIYIMPTGGRYLCIPPDIYSSVVELYYDRY